MEECLFSTQSLFKSRGFSYNRPAERLTHEIELINNSDSIIQQLLSLWLKRLCTTEVFLDFILRPLE